MAGLINDLMDAMSEMSSNVESLTELSRRKKEVVIQNDVEALKEITSNENGLVGRYQKAEKKAQAAMADIAMVLNQPIKGLTLSRIGELIESQSDHPAYMRIFKTLEERLGRLKRLNDQNRVLITNALDYIDYSMNVIRTANGQDDSAMFDSKN